MAGGVGSLAVAFHLVSVLLHSTCTTPKCEAFVIAAPILASFRVPVPPPYYPMKVAPTRAISSLIGVKSPQS